MIESMQFFSFVLSFSVFWSTFNASQNLDVSQQNKTKETMHQNGGIWVVSVDRSLLLTVKEVMLVYY